MLCYDCAQLPVDGRLPADPLRLLAQQWDERAIGVCERCGAAVPHAALEKLRQLEQFGLGANPESLTESVSPTPPPSDPRG